MADQVDRGAGSGEVLAEEFWKGERRGEFPSLEEYALRHPNLAEEVGEVFPALVMMDEMTRNLLSWAGRSAPHGFSRSAEAASGRRFPHPARDWPGRHGRRVRSSAGVPGPACRLESIAADCLPKRCLQRASSSASRAAAGRTIPTSCRFSASAKIKASSTTPCSSSRAKHWTLCSMMSSGCANWPPPQTRPNSRRRSPKELRRPRLAHRRIQNRRFEIRSRRAGPTISGEDPLATAT